MARRPLTAAQALAGSADEVEAEFYEALQRGDIERLMAVWADDDEIVCVHPGGGRAVGMADIRAAFEAVFAGGGLTVRPSSVRRLQHLGAEVHHLVECLEVNTPEGLHRAWVLATNVFIKTAQGWRLAAHHASPAAPQQPATEGGAPEAPSTLH